MTTALFRTLRGCWRLRDDLTWRDVRLLAMDDDAFAAETRRVVETHSAAVSELERVQALVQGLRARDGLRDAVRDPVGLLLALARNDSAAIRDVLAPWGDRRSFVAPLAAS